MRAFLPAIAVAAIVASPALAQTLRGVSQTDANGVTTTAFAVSPQQSMSAAEYVKLSADAISYQEQAATLAMRKAQRDDVKALAKAQLAAAQQQKGSLMAALDNKDRRIAKPNLKLSSDRAAKIALLSKAPRGSFDNLYLAQMADAAPTMMALQKNYAQGGSDPALRQVAITAVPGMEAGFTNAQGLMPAALSTVR